MRGVRRGADAGAHPLRPRCAGCARRLAHHRELRGPLHGVSWGQDHAPGRAALEADKDTILGGSAKQVLREVELRKRIAALEGALRRTVDHLAEFNRDYSEEATAETAAAISEAERILGASR